MAKRQTATVSGKSMHCPVCASTLFRSKHFYPSGTWAQAFDVEALFGREGVMLICENCSYIQHFADKRLITLSSRKNA